MTTARFLVPALEVASSLWMDEGRVTDVFRTGEGIAWSDHRHRLFCGSESLFRPGYKAHLAAGWIAALDGASEKLAASDGVEDNINPVSRLYYAASTAVCTPCSRSQEIGLALGARAGETRLSEVLEEAGFDNIRRAAETPFNLIAEARK